MATGQVILCPQLAASFVPCFVPWEGDIWRGGERGGGEKTITPSPAASRFALYMLLLSGTSHRCCRGSKYAWTTVVKPTTHMFEFPDRVCLFVVHIDLQF